MNNDNNMIKFKFIYPLSIVISYLIVTSGGGEIDFGLGIGILIYALFLCAPLLSEENFDKNPLEFWIFYVLWVGVQWLIYYYGIEPPHGVRGF